MNTNQVCAVTIGDEIYLVVDDKPYQLDIGTAFAVGSRLMRHAKTAAAAQMTLLEKRIKARNAAEAVRYDPLSGDDPF